MDNTTSEPVPLTVEQRTQAVIDLNKQIEIIPLIIDTLSAEMKQKLAEDIQKRKSELGLL